MKTAKLKLVLTSLLLLVISLGFSQEEMFVLSSGDTIASYKTTENKTHYFLRDVNQKTKKVDKSNVIERYNPKLVKVDGTRSTAKFFIRL